MSHLRFGYFIAPYHRAGTSPTVALHRDLNFVEHIDRLGFDEVWFGEHHSAGTEIIGSPEIFIAAAASRAPRITFGTGVVSVSYHNPLWAADRIVLLDHLTRGRLIFGVGPGSLPTDSAMIGLDPTQVRELLEEKLDIIVRLLNGEAVTATTATHTLVDARLQLRPFNPNGIPISVAAVASPTGARLAGRYGLGLLSIGATLTAEGFDALAHHWNIMEERAAAYGTTVDRSRWSLLSPFHLADTEEQARKEVAYGIVEWSRYFANIVAFPQMAVETGDVEQVIAFINDSGVGVIGTPDQARGHVERLWKQTSGFGSLLLMGHDWATPEATRRSAELFAEEVVPHFQGQANPTLEAADRAAAVREGFNKAQFAAIDHMTAKYQQELRDSEP